MAAAVLAELDRLAQRRFGPRLAAELKAALAELVDLGERRRSLPAARSLSKGGAELVCAIF